MGLCPFKYQWQPAVGHGIPHALATSWAYFSVEQGLNGPQHQRGQGRATSTTVPSSGT